MKRTVNILLLLVMLAAMILPAAVALAQSNKPGEFHMYHMVILRRGPNWKSQGTTEGMDTRMQAIEMIKQGARKGIIVAAGLVNDETDGEFILLLDVETKTEALALAHKAPLLKSGFYKADIYSWFATSTVKGGN
jgi:uncharacterized protein YciI